MRIDLPSHAYVPGRTERHAEDAFDAIRDTAAACMDADALAGSAAFLHGLAYLEQGFFWEAHEVLEPVWMALPEGSGARACVQGLIQLANAHLKARMEKPNAVRRLCAMARAHLEEARSLEGDSVLGVDLARMLDAVALLEGEL